MHPRTLRTIRARIIVYRILRLILAPAAAFRLAYRRA